MKVSVGVGRTIMQHKDRSAVVLPLARARCILSAKAETGWRRRTSAHLPLVEFRRRPVPPFVLFLDDILVLHRKARFGEQQRVRP
jgi:hypothetical protein